MATMTREDQIQNFLRTKGVTKCPPTTSHTDNAASLYKMRLARETALSTPVEEVSEERYVEAVVQARVAGMSVSDALDEGREVAQ